MPPNPKCKSSKNKEKLLIGTNEIVDVKMEENSQSTSTLAQRLQGSKASKEIKQVKNVIENAIPTHAKATINMATTTFKKTSI